MRFLFDSLRQNPGPHREGQRLELMGANPNVQIHNEARYQSEGICEMTNHNQSILWFMPGLTASNVP